MLCTHKNVAFWPFCRLTLEKLAFIKLEIIVKVGYPDFHLRFSDNITSFGDTRHLRAHGGFEQPSYKVTME